jgi:hypothetical protein
MAAQTVAKRYKIDNAVVKAASAYSSEDEPLSVYIASQHKKQKHAIVLAD